MRGYSLLPTLASETVLGLCVCVFVLVLLARGRLLSSGAGGEEQGVCAGTA